MTRADGFAPVALAIFCRDCVKQPQSRPAILGTMTGPGRLLQRNVVAGLMAMLAVPALAADLPKALRTMTPEAFGAAATVRHDPQVRTTTFSTEAGHVPSRVSPIRHLLSDNHLRAVIDWRTGAVRYEVHQRILYWGAHARDRRSYDSASYEAPDGIRVGGLIEARHGESFCPNEDNWGPCALTRDVAFGIGEEEVRAIAARYRPGAAEPWTYRIAERDGRHWEDAIVPAEAAGLLLAIERRRATAG